jgi:raffinose/stachyose/melibiose transport system substrate-binding protein
MKLTARPKAKLRSRAVVALATLTALTLAACGGPVGGGGKGSASQGGGSSTSGTVNWWGWTPTDTATANGYIAAFNKEYPNIKIN